MAKILRASTKVNEIKRKADIKAEGLYGAHQVMQLMHISRATFYRWSMGGKSRRNQYRRQLAHCVEDFGKRLKQERIAKTAPMETRQKKKDTPDQCRPANAVRPGRRYISGGALAYGDAAINPLLGIPASIVQSGLTGAKLPLTTDRWSSGGPKPKNGERNLPERGGAAGMKMDGKLRRRGRIEE
jgi:hypothetical protein